MSTKLNVKVKMTRITHIIASLAVGFLIGFLIGYYSHSEPVSNPEYDRLQDSLIRGRDYLDSQDSMLTDSLQKVRHEKTILDSARNRVRPARY